MLITKETKKMADKKGWILLGDTYSGTKKVYRVTGAEKIFKKQGI